ncbi:ferrous iron permease EfeU precursor [Clostridium saccharobutylicum]|uniref:Ferrous iron permease EfeU n=1 Tax=Clostridium saccharobutylicum TaxID=169679 RepID=A0A1S8N247_CLOSA|nr:ferrous iron permease EfeU precursor [Clostridium saccharobutylicum]
MLRKLFTLLLVVFLMLPMLTVKVLAADAKAELSKSNEFIEKSLEAVKVDDFSKGKDFYEEYNQAWIELEDGVKEQSKQAYGDIEGKMGMVKFLFSQDPVQKDKVINALEDLEKTNKEFIEGKSSSQETKTKGENTTIKDLVELLEKAKSQIESGNDDAERDMVSAKAYLTVDPIQKDKAVKVIDRMHGYLSLLDGNTSYGIVDVITIILREGLEALLVVIALLGFLKKSDQEDKKTWIYGGVIIGSIVSIVLAVLVKLLFTSGTFGNNNFLISGWTGVFAAVMLIYVSYWLHSKSSVDSRNHGIQDKSYKSLANGSLFSLGFLAFLAVFREGTEVVLFYIGMASSIKLTDLFLGIALGFAILIIIAVLMLKIGLRIPMKPFFLVSSLLVFYLGLKFTGMGINGLQLSGVLPATSSDSLPTISALAVYPTWQGVILQAVLVVIAILVILHNKLKRN